MRRDFALMAGMEAAEAAVASVAEAVARRDARDAAIDYQRAIMDNIIHPIPSPPSPATLAANLALIAAADAAALLLPPTPGGSPPKKKHKPNPKPSTKKQKPNPKTKTTQKKTPSKKKNKTLADDNWERMGALFPDHPSMAVPRPGRGMSTAERGRSMFAHHMPAVLSREAAARTTAAVAAAVAAVRRPVPVVPDARPPPVSPATRKREAARILLPQSARAGARCRVSFCAPSK